MHATQVLSVVVKAAAPVVMVKEHVMPGEKVLEADQTSSVYQAKPLTLYTWPSHITQHYINNVKQFVLR